jgi:hypothetical protein
MHEDVLPAEPARRLVAIDGARGVANVEVESVGVALDAIETGARTGALVGSEAAEPPTENAPPGRRGVSGVTTGRRVIRTPAWQSGIPLAKPNRLRLMSVETG